MKKYDCSPNNVVYLLYRFALKDWRVRKLDDSRFFTISIYLIELFGTKEFFEQLVRNPTESNDVVYLTFMELFNALRDDKWIRLNLTKPDTILTFDNLMTVLAFCRQYQVKVHDHGPVLQAKKREAEISDLILVLLKLLKSIVKSKTYNSK